MSDIVCDLHHIHNFKALESADRILIAHSAHFNLQLCQVFPRFDNRYIWAKNKTKPRYKHETFANAQKDVEQLFHNEKLYFSFIEQT